MDWTTILLFCSGGFYFLVNVGLAIGLWRRRLSPHPGIPSVSVIVAARNEEQTLPALLERLSAQTYSRVEFVIVNDRSADRTADILSSIQARDPRFKLVTISAIPDDMPGKKNALRAGIAQSRGEILCFTDADCLPGPEWISTLIRCFDEQTGMVAGFSPYLGHPVGVDGQVPFIRRWFYHFVSYEEFRGAIWAGGSIGWSCAWLCTGRNLAYRRAVYDDVGGFDAIKRSVSGDDDLFMQLVRRKTRWGIRYCYERANQVGTYPPRTFRAFVEQRTRHFSAGKFFSLPMKAFFAAYHTANLVVLGVFVGSLFVPAMRPVAFVGIGLKFIADGILALSGSVSLGQGRAARQFILMEILYVLYNWGIGPLGFTMTFRWKPDES